MAYEQSMRHHRRIRLVIDGRTAPTFRYRLPSAFRFILSRHILPARCRRSEPWTKETGFADLAHAHRFEILTGSVAHSCCSIANARLVLELLDNFPQCPDSNNLAMPRPLTIHSPTSTLSIGAFLVLHKILYLARGQVLECCECKLIWMCQADIAPRGHYDTEPRPPALTTADHPNESISQQHAWPGSCATHPQ